MFYSLCQMCIILGCNVELVLSMISFSMLRRLNKFFQNLPCKVQDSVNTFTVLLMSRWCLHHQEKCNTRPLKVPPMMRTAYSSCSCSVMISWWASEGSFRNSLFLVIHNHNFNIVTNSLSNPKNKYQYTNKEGQQVQVIK